MKRILVPVDFTDESMNSVEHAAKLAQTLNSSITLLHVEGKSAAERTGATSTAGINQLLDEVRDGVTRAFKVPCVYRIADAPGETLVSAIAASSGDHDMVVMGSNGSETVMQKLIGSHTWRVSQQLEIPLMLVPEGTTYRTPSSILFAVDITDAPGLEQLIELSEAFHSKVHMLHVEDPYYKTHTEKDMRELAAHVIRDAGTGVDISFNVIYNTDISSGIRNHMLECGYDLLAMHVKHKGIAESVLQRSISKRIAEEVLFPVLLFHH